MSRNPTPPPPQALLCTAPDTAITKNISCPVVVESRYHKQIYMTAYADGIRERTSSDDMSDPLVLSHTCKTFLSKPTCVTCHCHLSHSQAKIYPCLLNQQF